MAAVSLLSARGLTRSFGGLLAVDHVDFELPAGQVRAVIGPNGAGKTTFVNLLSGRLAPSEGSIFFQGRDITRQPAHARVVSGIAYTFQITSIFGKLSLYDNVALAARQRMIRDHSTGRGGGDLMHRLTMEALARVELAGLAQQIAGSLSYGHQRLLEIAMGLALGPTLLILDEPTQGLADGEIANFIALVRGVAAEATVLLIEHNMGVVMDLADRITVLNFGKVLAEGSPAEVRADPIVQSAYLGS